MNQQTADELIEKAVKSAIKEYSKEQKVERKRKALHNPYYFNQDTAVTVSMSDSPIKKLLPEYAAEGGKYEK